MIPFTARRLAVVVAYDYLERFFLHGIAKGVIGLHDLVQHEMMGNQLLRLEFSRDHGFQKQGRCDGVDQPCSESDILRPECFQI